MKAGIVLFPGINRERDMAIALEGSTGEKPRMIWHKDTDLDGVDLVVVPGGFSFGDYLRCGAMAARAPEKARRCRPVAASQTTISRSTPPEARVLPSAEKATTLTAPSWPRTA